MSHTLKRARASTTQTHTALSLPPPISRQGKEVGVTAPSRRATLTWKKLWAYTSMPFLEPGDVWPGLPRRRAHEDDLAAQDVLGLEVGPFADLSALKTNENGQTRRKNGYSVALGGNSSVKSHTTKNVRQRTTKNKKVNSKEK